MPLTFGGATTDRVEIASLVTQCANPFAGLYTCWVYPTTLTAGRYVCSWGSARTGVRIDTVTSELNVVTQRATTDAVHTTTSAGLAVNTWTFIAVLYSTSTAIQALVWTGTEAIAPQSRTVTATTAGTGTISSGTTLVVGNQSSGSVAFQGDIGDFRYMISSASASNILHPLFMGAAASYTQAQIDAVYYRYILPAWNGAGQIMLRDSAQVLEVGSWGGDGTLDVFRRRTFGTASFTPIVAPTLSGTAQASTRTPKPVVSWAVPSAFATPGLG